MNIVQLLAQPASQHDIDWLKEALQAAIQLELSTIPPYLCAMWSIKDSNHPAYESINEIVLEEMLHMGLACNMLTAIGGVPVINTPAVVPHYPGPLPGGVRPTVRVALSGLTKDVVRDVFMQIEYPESGPLAAALGEVFPTIGAFYQAILDAFGQLPATSITGQKQQLSPSIGLFKINSIDDVRKAITIIREQGEGTSQSPYSPNFEPEELSHYYEFAEIYHEHRIQMTAPNHWEYTGAPLPFPDCYPMAEVPPGGYPESTDFDRLYSKVLDRLQATWTTGASLGQAVVAMSALSSPAIALMSKALPTGAGNFGPSFQYIPPSSPVMASANGPGAALSRRRPPSFRRATRSAQLLTAAAEVPNPIVLLMAQREHRMHHYLWHEVRNGWLFYDQATRQAIHDLGWEPPRPSLQSVGSSRAPVLDNNSGEDFLYMHRQMIAVVNQRLAEISSPEYPRVEGWYMVPAPGDADYRVPPAWNTGDPDLDAFLVETKSDAFFTSTVQPWEQNFRDPAWLAGRTLGEMGARLEFTIHNRMHMRWCSDPGAIRPDSEISTPDSIEVAWDAPSYNWLGDTYSSHVNSWFWKIHGWVDDTIEAWKCANGVTGEIPWIGTWVGKMPPHPVPNSLHAILSGAGHAHHDHLSELYQLLRIIQRSGVRWHFYDAVSVPS